MATLTTEYRIAESSTFLRPQAEPSSSRVRVLGWSLVVTVALFMNWSARYTMNVDGMSYLDVADTYLRHPSLASINGYWSPMYSWVLAAGLGVLRPSPFWEFPTVQLINFLILLGALGCFDFFWFSQHRRDSGFDSQASSASFPGWAWAALGYALFLWTITGATVVSEVTPDLMTTGIVFLAAGIMVRLRAFEVSPATMFSFGLALGVGYLSKAAMFVLAPVFVLVAFFTLGSGWRKKAQILVAVAGFAVISLPYVAALSRARGHFTFGDSGKINYAWGLNRTAPFFNWQGEDPAGGKPQHPTRKLLEMPALYEFATPVGGTYPPHYDPSYWNAGLTPHFNLRQQARALITSGYAGYEGVLLPQSGLIAAAIILLFAGDISAALGRLSHNWHLWVPALAAVGMYALVTLEPRYVAPFVILLWAAVLSAVRLPESAGSKRLITVATLVGVFALSLSAAEKVGVRMYELNQRSTNRHWVVASELAQFGIQPGDRVVSLGSAYNAYWARLARVKIVGEVPSEDVGSFWASPREVKSEVYAICEQSNAKAIVTREAPRANLMPDWQKLGTTGYYVHRLAPAGTAQTH